MSQGGFEAGGLHPGSVRWLVIAAISLRLLAAGALAFGPWTNTPSELAGWDVERFQEIVDDEGRAWVDHPVEYPPGSVIVFESIAADDVVGTHRVLVLTSLLIDGAIAAAVAALGGRRAGAWYLLLGLPLVPMGLLRLDLWSVAAAVLGVVALARRRPAAFAVLTTIGALIKVWPALLLAPALGLGRVRAVASTVVAMAAAGIVWIGWAGWSLDPVSQVVSLRGATGWHLESVPGSLVALFTTEEPELQFNAYRIGTLSTTVVRAGQALTLAVIVALVLGARRAHASGRPRAVDAESGGIADGSEEAKDHGGPGIDLWIVAVVMVGAVSALLVTAPLLSPQFLLWLTPWAALAGSDRPSRSDSGPAPLAWPVGMATLLTGVTLAAFGPPDLDAPVPALLLLLRDASLIAAVGLALLTLHRSGTEPAWS